MVVDSNAQLREIPDPGIIDQYIFNDGLTMKDFDHGVPEWAELGKSLFEKMNERSA